MRVVQQNSAAGEVSSCGWLARRATLAGITLTTIQTTHIAVAAHLNTTAHGAITRGFGGVTIIFVCVSLEVVVCMASMASAYHISA